MVLKFLKALWQQRYSYAKSFCGVFWRRNWCCDQIFDRLACYFHFNLPVATFLVNIIGSFIIGFLYIIFVDKQEINPALKFALTVGFCGGLTTFSTFSLEIFEMLKNAQFLHAFCYVLLSVIICVISVWIGVSCAKLFI